MCIKIGVGISTGSMAILADALHSLADLANSIIAWVVIFFSSQPADSKHPYGHRKFETLAVFIMASILVVLAFELSLSAVTYEIESVETNNPAFILMLLVLGINIFISTWEQYWAKKLDSDILRADASHTFSDVLVTLSVIAGWQLSAMGYQWVDRLCALAVAGFVFYLSFKLFKRTLPALLDESAIDPQQLRKLISKVDGVKNVYKIRSRWIGKNRAVDLTVAVDAQISTEESHNITIHIEKLLEQELSIDDISIHVEPEQSS